MKLMLKNQCQLLVFKRITVEKRDENKKSEVKREK